MWSHFISNLIANVNCKDVLLMTVGTGVHVVLKKCIPGVH